MAQRFFPAFQSSAALIIVVLAAAPAALAGPGSVSSPGVEKGERAIESKTILEFDHNSDAYELEEELEIEYGISDRILAEIEAEFKKEQGKPAETDAVGVSIRYQLTDQDNTALASALNFSYGMSTAGEADSAGIELLLGHESGPYEVLANIETGYEIGDQARDGVSLDIAGGAYRSFAGWDLGIEYFGDFGNLRDLSGYQNQSHYIGPIVFSEVELPGETALEYGFGVYQGISRGAKDMAAKLELEFEF